MFFIFFIFMVVCIKTSATVWLQGYDVVIEADSNRALPTIDIIWLPDISIKESKERIKGAFRHCNLQIPRNKIILNLSPSDIKKSGTRYDLPMACAILHLGYEDSITNDLLTKAIILWELGLDGSVKRIDWLLPSVLSAISRGHKIFVIPSGNQYEVSYIQGISIYPIDHFQTLVNHVFGTQMMKPSIQRDLSELKSVSVREYDFAAIKGHQLIKRALSIAVAGRHNVLLIGAPWCGKTMLSRAIQSILPPLPHESILEVSKIYSLVGKLDAQTPLIVHRPFRQVHHTASKISIVGWGKNLTPWEVTLAHQGVLFFDELPEFPREVLEVLRQPIEDKEICISRVSWSVSYPANIMFVATMNPCKCGYYKDPVKACICSPRDIAKYQNTISWPLLDRIDMILEVPRENLDVLLSNGMADTQSSDDLYTDVLTARNTQKTRYWQTTLTSNADLQGWMINTYIHLDDASHAFLKQASTKLTLSPRVIHRIMKLARTIADMDGDTQVSIKHLAESLQYRSKSLFVEMEMM